MSQLTTSLADAVAAEVKKPGGKCSACTAAASLTAFQRGELDALLESDTPRTAIAKGLSKVSGVKVNPEALSKHAVGACSGG